MNRISLKYSIALTIFLLESIMVALILWRSLAVSYEATYTEHEKFQHVLTDMLGDQGRFALITGEYSSLQLYIDELRQDPHVEQVLLADFYDHVVAGSDLEFLGKAMPPLVDGRERHWHVLDLSNPAGYLGRLAVQFSESPFRAIYAKARLQGIVVALISMVLIALVGIFFGDLLTRRLHRLTAATKALAEGDLANKIDMAGDDEISHLAHNFDIMIEKVQTSIRDLESSERHYREFVEGTGELITSVNGDGRITYVNHVGERIFGVETGQLIGASAFDFIHPDDRRFTETWFRDCIQERKSQAVIENRQVNRQTGKVYHFLWTSNFHYDADGRVIGVNGIAHDITDRKQAEMIVRRAKEEWEKSFNAITDIVTVHDRDLRIIRANEAACKFAGLGPEEILGKKCYQVLYGRIEPCSGCPELEALGDAQSHSALIRQESAGKTFHVSVAPIMDENNGVEYLVHVAKDITEQKKLEEELFQSRKMEAIGTLAGGIAHDFNNMLAAILGYAELAKIDINDKPQLAADLDEVIKGAYRARDLVKQILTFSRKDEQKTEPLAPYVIVKESLKLLRASLPATIEIHEKIDKESGTILADPTRVHQIMVNLCTNAQHAMENEQGTLTVRLARRDLSAADLTGEKYLSPGPYVELAVSDTGHGMDSATLARIFEPYFTTKELGKGTGMGLAVVHGIVQDCGGMIRVESAPGQGTTFRIFFPAVAMEGSADAEEPAGALPRGNERILVVDDESAIAQMHKAMLERLGYTVRGMTRSLDALAAFKAGPARFDLVITDQTMPDMTGADLAKKILEIRPDVPILLCTGYSSLVSLEKARELGIREFMMKPVDSRKLAVTVRRMLDAG